MIGKEVIWSNKKESWETPIDLFKKLDFEFEFNLDPCVDEFNHKCELYFTKEQDGLSKDWSGYRVFCNPPYGRQIEKWVKKSYEESLKKDTIVVMLLPVRTDTRWFHRWIYGKAEVRFIKGRLKFGNQKENAPFPSMIVVFE